MGSLIWLAQRRMLQNWPLLRVSLQMYERLPLPSIVKPLTSDDASPPYRTFEVCETLSLKSMSFAGIYETLFRYYEAGA